MYQLDVTAFDNREARILQGMTVDQLVDSIGAALEVETPVAVIMNPNWPASLAEQQAITNAVGVRSTGELSTEELDDWLYEMRDSMEHGWCEVESDLDHVGAHLLIGQYREDGPPWYWVHWEAVNIAGHLTFISYRDDAYWEHVWASFGLTNSESRTGVYWSHVVGRVAPGVASIARDNDEYGRTVQVFEFDESDPMAIATLIRTVQYSFSDGDPFPEDQIDAYKQGKPIGSLSVEGGYRYDFDLDVSDEVLAEL